MKIASGGGEGAAFADVTRLEARNGNVFVQTEASGQFNLREAGKGGAGLVAPSALESANVDLGTESVSDEMNDTRRPHNVEGQVWDGAQD